MLNAKIIPSYVWQLPVTTEIARIEGVDLYGYPKFLADIRFSKNEDQVECTLSESGVDILRMTCQILQTNRGKPTRYVTYAVDDDVLVFTNFLVNPLKFAESRRKKDFFLEVGSGHPICQTLKDIELSSAPLIYQFMPRGEAILFPGRNIRDV